jgi:hypothetical protein
VVGYGSFSLWVIHPVPQQWGNEYKRCLTSTIAR